MCQPDNDYGKVIWKLVLFECALYEKTAFDFTIVMICSLYATCVVGHFALIDYKLNYFLRWLAI